MVATTRAAPSVVNSDGGGVSLGPRRVPLCIRGGDGIAVTSKHACILGILGRAAADGDTRLETRAGESDRGLATWAMDVTLHPRRRVK